MENKKCNLLNLAHLIISLFSILMYSCGFLFYNYRAKFDTEFLIQNNSSDGTIIKKVGNLIYSLSQNEEFYTRYKNDSGDSLFFYGPDYHTFKIKILHEKDITKVRLDYFGYNGNRKNPPHKDFINSITDSLVKNYGAKQVIYKNVNNMKIKNK